MEGRRCKKRPEDCGTLAVNSCRDLRLLFSISGLLDQLMLCKLLLGKQLLELPLLHDDVVCRHSTVLPPTG
jgi:hypothetical protein